ncbi:GNAT family N-acetyltransferase [Labrenzia sp. OB1]|uniref:GNAT family N-acetyltransferase n=1 Tax=Labrenzia sp. OB1 TaxID=1561204 RepID=UPI0007B2E489|nr:GNAT family N-acetyltransferase [Labrenzia sp. OB1]KZM51472.1 hypothetical protein OA90_03105 [Labrenzia sp. OB1]
MALSVEPVEIRRAQPRDLDAVNSICLLTGDAGKDASSLYKDPGLIGAIYAAPYVALKGAIAVVAEDLQGVAGYAVGAADTRGFERRLETDWWPELRERYAEPEGDRADWSPDEVRSWMIHHLKSVPDEIVRLYPAHIHMNLHPRAQGRGIGSRLLQAWLAAAGAEGVTTVHAGVSAVNDGGLKFWAARGFKPVLEDRSGGSRGTIWCGFEVNL